MNSLMRFGCRTVQLAFRLAMPLLPYREPERLEHVADLPDLLAREGIPSVLLVTDHPLREAGVTAPLEALLQERGVRCAVYDRTRANPTVHNVEEAYALYCAEDCCALIAFGGGSSMDCAKAVGARAAYPKRQVNDMKGLLRVWRRLPLLIAIPTTAGTGSEVTITAVITDSERRHKYTMNNFTMIPRCAVLDPAVTCSLPPALTATTGMDALTHAVEAYIGSSTTKETRRLALKATALVFENIQTAYTHGGNLTARQNMLMAAHIAGIAFSKSYVGYIHAVAHSLGGQYNIPHGLANAVLMPYVLEAYGSCVHKKLYQLGLAAGVALQSDDERTGAEKFIAAIRELNRRMGIPNKLPGIQRADIPAMARHAHREANPLYPVPRLMDAPALERFYYDVMEEEKAT
ncbi:MAG: iron-containing alcohol dehydrogenase [Oscillospiraceae bacterium]|jgi:alcohol dehydrogenase|nr:iron-containing alcohol dehydrogenase [Oscillospiraceae bacterium]